MGRRRKDGSTNELRPLCACGCDTRVAKYRAKYIGNHRRAHMLKLNPRPLCACGCGEPVEHADNQPWKWNKYIHNHHQHRENHPKWRGGEMRTARGYVFVLCPGHPKARSSGHVKRATLVAERKIGRYLRPGEEVHHINEDKSDDRPENLQVLTHAEHAALHRRKLNASQRAHKTQSASMGRHPGSGA